VVLWLTGRRRMGLLLDRPEDVVRLVSQRSGMDRLLPSEVEAGAGGRAAGTSTPASKRGG
jgi:hypothetical protein